MPLHIYNSLTKEKDSSFEPLKPPEVNIYTCGVTVYDECHIGHARSLYVFEVMRRYLEYKGYKVNFVRNITDIDDKIIKRANELKVNWQDLVEKYISSYKKDLESLGVREGLLDKDGQEPRATRNIPEMVEYIQGLIDKGYAYATNTGVYFSVRKFNNYGKLSHQSPDQMLTGVRKEADETKDDPLDFALWKLSKPDEPKWPSPWGEGRPGWHIECSVMSQKFLKTDTLDIHAGGLDLVFPHHENEIAQAEAFTGKPFAKYWIHHGLLTINGHKMSKSLGNFITIQDVLSKYPADVLKIFYLQAHYSSSMDFSWEKMEEAKEAMQRFEEIQQRTIEINDKAIRLKKIPSNSKAENIDFIEENKNGFFKAMDDDFNTPRALSCLFDLIKDTNKFIDSEEGGSNYYTIANTANSIIFDLARRVFGLSIISVMKGLPEDAEMLIREREEDRANKRFKEADKKREKLEKMGIIIKDTKDGKTTWRRKL